MPGFDGTGPRGQGPMTGGARGFCAGYYVPGRMNPGFGFGYGRGLGRGRGFGRGFGWRRLGYGQPYPTASAADPKVEAQILKEEAQAMQNEINAINERIKELESGREAEKD